VWATRVVQCETRRNVPAFRTASRLRGCRHIDHGEPGPDGAVSYRDKGRSARIVLTLSTLQFGLQRV